jgi:hypothetical protein
MATEAVKVDGLAQFIRAVKRLDSDLPKMNRQAMNSAADIVLDYARPRIPRRTGRAASTLKAKSTQTAVRVVAGGRRAPWYPWLDFGGKVGRNKSVERPFYKEGRYLYPALRERRAEFVQALTGALVDTARSAGLDVS